MKHNEAILKETGMNIAAWLEMIATDEYRPEAQRLAAVVLTSIAPGATPAKPEGAA